MITIQKEIPEFQPTKAQTSKTINDRVKYFYKKHRQIKSIFVSLIRLFALNW